MWNIQQSNRTKYWSESHIRKWYSQGKEIQSHCVHIYDWYESYINNLCPFFCLSTEQLNYNNQPIQVDLCKNDKKIEIDYTQSTVKMFFVQNAQCGQDGKRVRVVIAFLSC